MRHIKILLLLLVAMLPASAHAQLPSTCFTYGLDDSFEGTSVNGWLPWNYSVSGVIRVGATGSARTGANAALFSFGNNEPLGHFLIIDKFFALADTTTAKRRPRYGCAHTIPYFPEGHPEYCSASIWVKSASDGARGYMQLLDPDSYLILAQADFNHRSPGTWTQVSIANTTSCRRNMIVRVALVRASSLSDAMVVDDLHIDWNY